MNKGKDSRNYCDKKGLDSLVHRLGSVIFCPYAMYFSFVFFFLYSYDEWIKFNDAQRAHYNYLEAAPTVLTFLLVGGSRAPLLTSGVGLTYLIGRELYGQGYANKGPQARLAGSALSGLSLIGLFGTAIYSAVKIARSTA